MDQPICKLPVKSWCHSMCDLIKVDFEWTIQQFELRDRFRTTVEFSADDAKISAATTWKLIRDDDGIHIAHGLVNKRISFPELVFFGTCKKSFRVKTAFVNAKGDKFFTKEFVVRRGMEMPVNVNATTHQVLIDNSNDLVTNGNITIICQIETYKDFTESRGQNVIVVEEILSNKDELVNDFQELFESKKMSDVVFRVQCHRFRAHKAILAARSPVFAAMFQHSTTRENLTNIVDVPDIDPNVFNVMLRYMYTGQVLSKQMEEVAAGLVAAADKYMLEQLKEICGNHIVNHMSPDICVQLLSLGLGEHDPAYCLREKAVNYLRQFPTEVMATASWKKVVKEKAVWIVDTKEMLLETLGALVAKTASKR